MSDITKNGLEPHRRTSSYRAVLDEAVSWKDKTTTSAGTIDPSMLPLIRGSSNQILNYQSQNPLVGYGTSNPAPVAGISDLEQYGMGAVPSLFNTPFTDAMALQAIMRLPGAAGAGPTTGSEDLSGLPSLDTIYSMLGQGPVNAYQPPAAATTGSPTGGAGGPGAGPGGGGPSAGQTGRDAPHPDNFVFSVPLNRWIAPGEHTGNQIWDENQGKYINRGTGPGNTPEAEPGTMPAPTMTEGVNSVGSTGDRGRVTLRQALSAPQSAAVVSGGGGGSTVPGQSPAYANNDARSLAYVMSGGINRVNELLGGEYGSMDLGPQLNLPGHRFTGAQHEFGGNTDIANAAASAGWTPQDMARWLAQGQQARNAERIARRPTGYDASKWGTAAEQAAGRR